MQRATSLCAEVDKNVNRPIPTQPLYVSQKHTVAEFPFSQTKCYFLPDKEQTLVSFRNFATLRIKSKDNTFSSR